MTGGIETITEFFGLNSSFFVIGPPDSLQLEQCGMNSERRELRKRIREFVEQNPNNFGRPQQTTASDQKLNNIVNINIGTDEKPKYVWRVCKYGHSG